MSQDQSGAQEMGLRRASGSPPSPPPSSRGGVASPSLRRASLPKSPLRASSPPFVLLLVAAAAAVVVFPSTVIATRHNFATYQDARFLVGPIGTPYGFLRDGVYNLTVFDFEMTVGHRKPKKRKKKSAAGEDGEDKEEEKAQEVEGFEAGFLLKRFESESDFARYQEVIMDDPHSCSYDSFRVESKGDGDGDENDPLAADDDDEFNKAHAAANPPQPQSSESVIRDGIFLSMKDVESTWRPNTPSISHTFKVEEEGLYFLLYQVCPTTTKATTSATTTEEDEKKEQTTFKEVRSTFELDLAYKNYDALGNPSYLTAGEMPLPTMFLYFSVSYALCLCIWVANIRQIQRGDGGGGPKPTIFANVRQIRRGESGGPKPTVYHIHHMMTVLILLKTLSVFFESVRYHYIRASGHAELWSTIYYAFAFLKGTFLFTVILLIGSGWSFVKPFLNDREKKVICLVLVLQVIDNVAVVILTHETVGERLYDDWSAVLHMVDILCCCAVLVPIVWQVNALESSVESTPSPSGGSEGGGDGEEEEGASLTRGEEASEAASSGGDSARTLQKLKLFRSFYLLVISYIYFTRIAVFLFATILGYRRTWLRYFVTELGTLAFYVVAGFQFRPMVENPYLEVKKDDYDDGSRADADVGGGAVGAVEMGSVGNGREK